MGKTYFEGNMTRKNTGKKQDRAMTLSKGKSNGAWGKKEIVPYFFHDLDARNNFKKKPRIIRLDNEQDKEFPCFTENDAMTYFRKK